MLILWAEEYLEVIIVKQSMGRSVSRTCMLMLWAKGYLEVILLLNRVWGDYLKVIVLLNRTWGDQYVEPVC